MDSIIYEIENLDYQIILAREQGNAQKVLVLEHELNQLYTELGRLYFQQTKGLL